MILPVALTIPVVATLPPVTLPVALTILDVTLPLVIFPRTLIDPLEPFIATTVVLAPAIFALILIPPLRSLLVRFTVVPDIDTPKSPLVPTVIPLLFCIPNTPVVLVFVSDRMNCVEFNPESN